jgi:pyridinium-3,5-biscarboxylic acid mononucleotide synthase
MNPEELKILLDEVRDGRSTVEQAIDRLKFLPFEDLGFAKVDTHRALRRGFPEVIFGEGKKPDQIVKILLSLKNASNNLMVTRCSREVHEIVSRQIPEAVYHQDARMIVIRGDTTIRGEGIIAVLCAGTLDIPVAEEAAITAEVLGNKVERLYDVGVAGIHRLLHYQRQLQEARVIIVVAGMEGALPSVVGGIVAVPVIAVPTSVGYGTSFGGITALLAMLNSCASGVVVVNIDNGFGAAYAAALINRKHEPPHH